VCQHAFWGPEKENRIEPKEFPPELEYRPQYRPRGGGGGEGEESFVSLNRRQQRLVQPTGTSHGGHHGEELEGSRGADGNGLGLTLANYDTRLNFSQGEQEAI